MIVDEMAGIYLYLFECMVLAAVLLSKMAKMIMDWTKCSGGVIFAMALKLVLDLRTGEAKVWQQRHPSPMTGPINKSSIHNELGIPLLFLHFDLHWTALNGERVVSEM